MPGVQTSTALISLVLNAGVSARELALAAGLDPRLVETPTLIPYEDGMRLWRAAEELTGDPAVGLHAGARCSVDGVPVLGTLFGHSDDLRDALERLSRLLPSAIRNAPIELEITPSSACFSYRSPSTARHGVDAMFAAIVQLARGCATHAIIPRAVAMQSDPPPSPAHYERFFGVCPRWQAPISSLSFDAADLARPFRGAAPALARVLESSAPTLIAPNRPTARGFSSEVAEAVNRCIDRGARPTITAVGALLDKSERTVQRLLSESDLTFRAVRDEVLKARAQAMVLEGVESTEAIAARLGFASRTSFERAYRRWVGESPAQTRERARDLR